MNFSPHPEAPAPEPDRDAAAPASLPDPYEALDDLMAVIEVLCPVWPDKMVPRVTVGFLL
jgi:hypothetical protein